LKSSSRVYIFCTTHHLSKSKIDIPCSKIRLLFSLENDSEEEETVNLDPKELDPDNPENYHLPSKSQDKLIAEESDDPEPNTSSTPGLSSTDNAESNQESKANCGNSHFIHWLFYHS